ncbi:hypothetical protein EYF80_046646 [Liparis tanakae]|uniref:Uncharacterized protein n=1 Tax=Liparis tanakae TaxID=230148 RepID=A0A4Z2FQ83_9TELE|nr:hypothetical protein EYF80_046646 [Liparis tanakae]
MPLKGKWRVVGSNFQELQMAPLLFTTEVLQILGYEHYDTLRGSSCTGVMCTNKRGHIPSSRGSSTQCKECRASLRDTVQPSRLHPRFAL